jgi:hypothetical protein
MNTINSDQTNMIPQVGYHSRHSSQQFGGPGFAAPPFDVLPNPKRLESLPPLPFRSPRTVYTPSILAPPHRAYPVQRHEPQRPNLGNVEGPRQGHGGQYHDPSEHMLRRKTPNGTLAAGYDGTPVQWSSKAPPLKHLVLPISGASSGSLQLAASFEGSRARQLPRDLSWNYPQTGYTNQFAGLGDEPRMNNNPGNWSKTHSFSDSNHNVWDCIRSSQAPVYYPNNGIQVPTVLQPAYQPSPGPTASNDGGYYGPYWPDGRFVPYRPAAVRDHVQHHFDPAFDIKQGLDRNHHIPMLPPLSTSQSPFNIGRDLFQYTASSSYTVQRNSLDIREGHYTVQPEEVFRHNADISLASLDGSRTPTAQSTRKANNPHFKEKTLSWAHSIYVDLLAFLHHSKKDNRQGRNQYGVRTKSSIYPKPPRQPSFCLTSSINDCVEVNHKMSPSSSTPFVSRPSHLATKVTKQNTWQPIESRHSRSSTQDVPHYISPFQAPNQLGSSPLSKAKEALDILTSLCDQSGWCWVDGMLLGGCLAYGLGEYHKALDWYSKIIALDPK